MPRITSHQSPSSPCSLLSSCKSISNLLFQTALIASPGSDFNCNAKRQTACGGGHLQPSSSSCTSLRVALSLAASCHIRVSLPSRSPYQGSSEREGSGQGAPTVAGAARSDPALEPPPPHSDGGFQKLTCRGRALASGTMGPHRVSRLGSRQRKKIGISERDKRRRTLVCRLHRAPSSILGVIRCESRRLGHLPSARSLVYQR